MTSNKDNHQKVRCDRQQKNKNKKKNKQKKTENQKRQK